MLKWCNRHGRQGKMFSMRLGQLIGEKNSRGGAGTVVWWCVVCTGKEGVERCSMQGGAGSGKSVVGPGVVRWWGWRGGGAR